MKLELCSWMFCPYVHRVSTLLREKGAAFDLKYVDLQNKPDWFLKISPHSMVPVLVADGASIYESLAINEFVDEVVGPRMMPEDPVERARHRAGFRLAEDLFNAMNEYLLAPNEAAHEKGKKAINDVFTSYERVFAGPLFAGKAFSLPDAAAAPVLFRCVVLQRNSQAKIFEGHPTIERWAELLSDRPSVLGGVVEEFVPKYLMRARSMKQSYFVGKYLS